MVDLFQRYSVLHAVLNYWKIPSFDTENLCEANETKWFWILHHSMALVLKFSFVGIRWYNVDVYYNPYLHRWIGYWKGIGASFGWKWLNSLCWYSKFVFISKFSWTNPTMKLLNTIRTEWEFIQIHYIWIAWGILINNSWSADTYTLWLSNFIAVMIIDLYLPLWAITINGRFSERYGYFDRPIFYCVGQKSIIISHLAVWHSLANDNDALTFECNHANWICYNAN